MFELSTPPESTLGIVDPSSGRRNFELTRIAPAPDLASLIDWHWVITWQLPPGAAYTQTLVPHPCGNIVAEEHVFAAHAMPEALYERRLIGAGGVVGTKLRPGALRVIAGLRDAGRAGLVLPAERFLRAMDRGGSVLDVGRAAISEALAGRPENAVAALTPLLRDAAERRSTAVDTAALARVADAFEAMRQLGPGEPVARLSSAVGVTPRTLQRLFANWVGVGPKWVLQRHRVHLAAELLAHDPHRDLAELAAEVGYYDQAHFGTDFARATGQTPAAYARRCAASLTLA